MRLDRRNSKAASSSCDQGSEGDQTISVVEVKVEVEVEVEVEAEAEAEVEVEKRASSSSGVEAGEVSHQRTAREALAIRREGEGRGHKAGEGEEEGCGVRRRTTWGE